MEMITAGAWFGDSSRVISSAIRLARGEPRFMSPFHDESPAFRQALLKSERLCIFFYSLFGLFEWANASEELFGTERLQNSVRAYSNKLAAEIVSILYEDVLRFAGGTSQKDDLTAIVIKRI
jgi:hypothetical protein